MVSNSIRCAKIIATSASVLTVMPMDMINPTYSSSSDNKGLTATIRTNATNSQSKGYIPYFCGYNSDESKGVLNLKKETIRNLEKLNQIKELVLESSENFISFSDDFINALRNVILKLKTQPEIFPNFSGNIQLEYDRDGKYLEIEISPKLQMSIFKIDQNGEEYETENIVLNTDTINEEIESFYGI